MQVIVEFVMGQDVFQFFPQGMAKVYAMPAFQYSMISCMNIQTGVL